MIEKNTIFVIFGATGDLTKRKLIPAFYNLYKNGKLPEKFRILGASGTDLNDERFRDKAIDSLNNFDKDKINLNIDNNFLSKIFYNQLDLTTIDGYKYLLDRINSFLKQDNNNLIKTEIICYLAIPPQLFETVLSHLDSIGFNKYNKNKTIKIIFEKPFGFDLKSAQNLNESLMKVFDENQVFRIDHYLGKDAVQNFLAVRFANSIFEPVWNHRYIDNIQITAFEKLGVEQRAGYYDKAGALRDMVQNHLLQMLSYIAMEPPTELVSNKIRDEKAKVLSSIKKISEDGGNNVIFGQYDKGLIDKKEVKSYLKEDGIKENSRTETFVAAKFEIDNWRWSNVPFYLRTGKRMSKKGTVIVIEFKKLPSILFNKNDDLEPNRLIIEVQPDASIDMLFNIKSTESKHAVTPIVAQFDKKHFADLNSHEAYENLFVEILKGDQSLFTRWDGVKASWEIVDSMVNCKDNCPIIYKYEAGSTGPIQSEKLLENDSRKWYNL